MGYKIGNSLRTAMGFGLGLGAGWLLLPTPLWVCGLYRSDAAPAWVQAIGSIAAILVAAGIPAWQEWRKDTDDEKRLSIATLRLRSNLEALGAATGEKAAKIRSSKIDAPFKVLSDMVFQITLWEISPVEQRIDQIHDLDPKVTKPILALLEEYDQYLLVHERVRTADAETIHTELQKCGGALIGRLERIGQLAFSASTAIRLIDEEQRYPDIRERNERLRAQAAKKKVEDARKAP